MLLRCSVDECQMGQRVHRLTQEWRFGQVDRFHKL